MHSWSLDRNPPVRITIVPAILCYKLYTSTITTTAADAAAVAGNNLLLRPKEGYRLFCPNLSQLTSEFHTVPISVTVTSHTTFIQTLQEYFWFIFHTSFLFVGPLFRYVFITVTMLTLAQCPYCWLQQTVNPLNTKRRLLYLKAQFVPRSKHFSSRL